VRPGERVTHRRERYHARLATQRSPTADAVLRRPGSRS
jgi:hypothetical protein